jgi:hypothetical protein
MVCCSHLPACAQQREGPRIGIPWRAIASDWPLFIGLRSAVDQARTRHQRRGAGGKAELRLVSRKVSSSS